MQKQVLLALILLVALIAPAVADDEPLIIFNMKNFTDTGDMVHVEGTLTEVDPKMRQLAKVEPCP
jgi:hypothetical protein